MALASLCSRSGCDSLWEPVSIELFWEPYQSLKPQQRSAARSVTKAASGSVETRVDWLETPESHVFKADLPGLKKEEVKVDVEDGNVLKISGERAREEAKETDRWHRAERSQGQFLRKFRLPKNVQLEEVAATVENGVLTVTVPKVAEKKPEVRNIEISWSE